MAITNAYVHPTPSIGKARSASQGVNQVGTLASLAGLTKEEFGGNNVTRQTLLTLTACALSITDALAYSSQLLYTFPEGRIHVADCVATLQFTTTSTLASTLNASSAVSWGIGSAAASATTLATTMMNFLPGSGESVKTFTSSATINVAGTAVTGFLAAVSAAHLAAIVDGTGTAVPVYLNLAVATGTDIDGDATLTVTGTILITWMLTGDL